MEQMIFKTPGNIRELICYLKDADDNTYILNGGTDLVVKFRNLGIYSGKVIDISGIEELKYIKVEDDYIKVGANTTFSEIGESEVVKKHAACIAEVASQVGSKQIRNMARMAGNIANSSPGGDSIPALLAAGAKVKIVNGNGEITFKTIDEIVVGIGKNSLKKDEAIIEIMIPFMDDSYRSTFGKYGMGSSRTTVIIANISITGVVKYNRQSGLIEYASVVLGAAAPVAYHAVNAEKVLTGKVPTEKLGEEFARALQEHVRESINGIKMFESKIDAVKGLGLSVYNKLFGDVLIGGDK